jgi:hypothetical protein
VSRDSGILVRDPELLFVSSLVTKTPFTNNTSDIFLLLLLLLHRQRGGVVVVMAPFCFEVTSLWKT